MSEERDLKEELALTRKAVGDLEKILLREGSHAASYEERLADALRERDDAKTRLEVEQASNQFLSRQVEGLEAEVKYLREHMENAGGDAWADAEGHEIRSYLRSILRGPKKETP